MKLFPAANLIARVEALLNQIISNAPVGVKYSIEAVNKGLDTSLAEGPPAGSFAVRDLRGNRRQERRNIRLSCEACSKVPGTLAHSGDQTHFELPLRSDRRGKTHGRRKHLFRTESRGPRELHRRSQRGDDPFRLRRGRHQSGAARRRAVENRAKNPAAAAFGRALSLPIGESKQTWRCAQSESCQTRSRFSSG